MGNDGGKPEIKVAGHPIGNSTEVIEVAIAASAMTCGLEYAVDSLDGGGGHSVRMNATRLRIFLLNIEIGIGIEWPDGQCVI